MQEFFLRASFFMDKAFLKCYPVFEKEKFLEKKMADHVKSHLGVYAFILDEKKEALLLIKKARGPYTGTYDLPGGTIESDELIEETLAREIKEETDCQLVSCQQIMTVDTRFEWDRSPENKPNTLFKHIGILYIATVQGIPSCQGDGLDSKGACWVKIQAIQRGKVLVSPFVKKGLEKIDFMRLLK